MLRRPVYLTGRPVRIAPHSISHQRFNPAGRRGLGTVQQRELSFQFQTADCSSWTAAESALTPTGFLDKRRPE
jgi:hypothetical protein